jgi:methylglutaconyl-CoA hydratase
MYETLELHADGPVATVTLNRPDVRNAFNARMIEELTQVFSALNTDPDIRVVVLQGKGKSFSAGADVNWMRASLDFTIEENRADALRMSDMFAAIDSIQKAVVARVHGAALGGGMGLLAVCDIVVAAESTVFGFTETKLGIVPAVISRFVFPKLGESWARALFLTGERFDSQMAHGIGLVHWTAPDGELDNVVRRKVDELLAAGPAATREAKALAAALASLDRSAVREFTADLIARLRTGEEGQEGLRAFLEKRPPWWVSDVSRRSP